MLASNILTYSDFLKDSKEPLEIRKAMVARYKELKSITAVALEFNTTRKTVRKWVNRFTRHILKQGVMSLLFTKLRYLKVEIPCVWHSGIHIEKKYNETML